MPVYYNGDEFTFYNPDGSEIKVRGWGSQFSAVFETLDGFTIVQDPESGFFHYAILSEDGTKLLPSGTLVGTLPPQQLPIPRHLRLTPGSGRKALSAPQETGIEPRWKKRRRERRERRSLTSSSEDTSDDTSKEVQLAATIGSYVGTCLLIQFPDVPGTISQQEVNNFCNQPGYTGFNNNGSVRDYFYNNSDQKLTYTNVVTAYYTAQHNRDHYTDPNVSYGTRAREVIIEALNHFKAQGFNFEQLTADSSGYVQALNVFYAGPSVNNWAKGLWPHSSALATPYVASSTRRFSDYQITNMGSQLTVRTFCHENGHMICDFPDLYSYTDPPQHNGVGHYCLMCFGGSNTNPTQVCAYLKNYAGWTSSLRQIAPGMSYSIAAGKNDFLIQRMNQTEYFIVENRAKSGRDEFLPDAGLAIWHVLENGNNPYNPPFNQSKPLECSLEQADGRFDLENKLNGGDADDLFGAPTAPTFGNATSPNSSWNDGNISGLEFTSISAPGSTMTVNTQVLWQNDRVVLRVHAKNGSRQTWAFLQGDSNWLSIGGASTDGNTNVFMALCEALANNRKVDVLVSSGRIIETALK